MERKKDLQERLLAFSKEVSGLCDQLPSFPECDRIRRQLAGSASSIGANFEEADAALTKKNFINKAVIARKEAQECRFFLRLIAGTYIREKRIEWSLDEIEELIKILSSMVQKASKGRQA
jgi:four helix bundle protein